MINPDFLNTFIDLTETKSFTATAKRLSMTQPGVSQHLRNLEDYFGTLLIERVGKSFELTEAGRRVLAYSKDLFKEHEDLLQNLETDDPKVGVCRMAAPGSFGIHMYSFLLKLAKKNPRLIMHFSYTPNVTIIREVREDKLDLGFVSQKFEDHDLKFKAIDEEQLCLIVPKDFSGSSFESLKALGFINHPDGFHHASRLLSENFPKDFKGMQEFSIKGHINQVTRILEPVALGLGFTALPEYACKSFAAQNKIKILPLKKQVIDKIWMVSKKQRTLPARFASIMEEWEQSRVK